MSEPEKNSGSGFGFTEIIVLVCIIGFLAWVAKPNFIGSHTSSQNACINNLRQIDSAINEWASEKGKTNGTVVVVNEITNYIELNSKGQIPACPSGGKYTFGKVGNLPQVTCSLSTATSSHKLP